LNSSIKSAQLDKIAGKYALSGLHISKFPSLLVITHGRLFEKAVWTISPFATGFAESSLAI
jgi:hypothetical protein